MLVYLKENLGKVQLPKQPSKEKDDDEEDSDEPLAIPIVWIEPLTTWIEPYLFKIIIKLPLEDWQPSSKVPVIKFFERDNYFKNL